MICVSIGNISFYDALNVVEKHDFFELRHDMLNFSKKEIRRIVSSRKKFISANHSRNIDNNFYKVHKATIEAGAEYIDIDLFDFQKVSKQFLQYIDYKGVKTIISYHNFSSTPDRLSLLKIMRQIYEYKADIAKVACYSRNIFELKRILDLYSIAETSLIALSMGKMGVITRIAALKKAPFTYASVSNRMKTASGQISSEKMKIIERYIK